MVYNTADNNYGVAKWIVDATEGQGTHQTIQAAITAASSGDTIFIRPGTYTETITLKAGVSLTAFTCNGYQPNVIYIGKMTASTAGTFTISGMQLKTNSSNFLVVSGSVATIVKLKECLLTVSANSVAGISYTSSSASSSIEMDHCQGDVSGTSSNLFTSTGVGTLKISYCNFTNSAAGTTANTTSATLLNISYSTLFAPLSVTSPVALSEISYSTIDCGVINATALTTVTSLTLIAQSCTFRSGTASAVSVGASSTLNMYNTTISSSNTNAVTGSGTLNYSTLVFSGTSSTINVTTQAGGLISGGKFQAPSAGFIGERIVSTVSSGSPVSVPSSTVTTVTSVSLTSGVWDITALCCLQSALTGNFNQAAISANNNSFTGCVQGDTQIQTPTMPTASDYVALVIPNVRVTLTATTTYYMVSQANYSVGTATAFGRLSAVRIS